MEKDKAQLEQEAVDRQYKKVLTDLDGLDTDEAKEAYLKDLASQGGLNQETLASLQGQIENGLPVDEVLKDGLAIALPIWLKEQHDETRVPSGLHLFEDLLPLEMVDNGNITFDYQDFVGTDGKNPFYGASSKDSKSWVDLTTSQGEIAGIETYMVDMIIHKQAIVYKPIFTKAHKNTVLFTIQFNNLVKKVGQALLNEYFAIRGKVLVAGQNARKDITITDSGITYKPTQVAIPDYTINATNGYDMVQQLNVLIKKFTVPSRKHLKGTRDTEFKIKGIDTSLQRSLDLNNFRIIAPNSFIEAYDKGVRAGAFQGEAAALISPITKAFYSTDYETALGDEHANITGLKYDIKAPNKDAMSGSADLFLIVPDTYVLIQQFKSDNRFELPNNTSAINHWENLGIATKKYENRMVLHIQVNVKPEATK